MKQHRGALCVGLVAVSWLMGAAVAAAQTDHGFMPTGGNLLLQQMLAPAPKADLYGILAAKHDAAGWRDLLRPRSEGLSDQELRTLAAYLAGNLPLPPATAEAATAASLASILPPDGDELAWNNCGSCHSLFTSYLTQERDVKGWLSVFLSPFHRGIRMTAQQRTTFAAYSAINMPLPPERVPPDLRY